MTVLASLVLLAASAVPQDPWPFVWAGWSIAMVAIVAYAVRTILRGRHLARRLPPEQRRWM